jgi:hypothetical protein
MEEKKSTGDRLRFKEEASSNRHLQCFASLKHSTTIVKTRQEETKPQSNSVEVGKTF